MKDFHRDDCGGRAHDKGEIKNVVTQMSDLNILVLILYMVERSNACMVLTRVENMHSAGIE